MKKSASEKLRNLRNAYGLSQAKFADGIGITRGQLASYEYDIHPLTKGAKFKILQTTGIGFEYWDSDMELWEAFEKYGLDPNHLKLTSKSETIITFKDSLKEFADITYIDADSRKKTNFLNTKIKHLKFISNYENDECYFVKIVGKEAEPLAKHGDILVVIQDEFPEHTNWIIVNVNDNILVKQYLLTGNDEISLKSSSDDSYKFSKADFEKQVKVLGIIKSKISIEIF